MTETKKRQRAPKQLTKEQLLEQFRKLELKEQIGFIQNCNEVIDLKKRSIESELELINLSTK